MANTVVLATQELETGEFTAVVTLQDTSERRHLRLTSQQLGSASSQARMVVRDSEGKVRQTVRIDGSGTEDASVDQIDGEINFFVECGFGNCLVTVTDITDVEGVLGVTGAVETDDIAAGAVAPTKLGLTGIKVLRFDGVAAAGPATLTGASVGERVLAVMGVISSTGVSVVGGTNFESVITVADQIQQSLAADLSGNDYWVILLPAAA